MTILMIVLAIILVVLCAIYYALRPCNRIKKLGDLGLFLGDPELKGVYRERQITRLAKLRRIGELPPVYPNGWYCIAESDEIKPKCIKEVTIFGYTQFSSLRRDANVARGICSNTKSGRVLVVSGSHGGFPTGGAALEMPSIAGRWYSQFYKENSPRLLPNGELSNRPKSIYDW
ncbi:hypothetical protein RB195_004692 [Necator americanus]|uniref:Uncharacterized protein n=1 Tax=Necator americanus TaxID=51031 RepID=A0ABR1BKW4_NECAM